MTQEKNPSEPSEDLKGADLIGAAATGQKLSPKETEDALEWFLYKSKTLGYNTKCSI